MNKDRQQQHTKIKKNKINYVIKYGREHVVCEMYNLIYYIIYKISPIKNECQECIYLCFMHKV